MATLNAGFVTTITSAVTSQALPQTGIAEIYVIVDGGPGPDDAAKTIGVQPNGFALFGAGKAFYTPERHTLTPAEVTEWLGAYVGPGTTVTNSVNAVNLSTGAVSATRFRFRGMSTPEIALGNAQSPPVVF